MTDAEPERRLEMALEALAEGRHLDAHDLIRSVKQDLDSAEPNDGRA